MKPGKASNTNRTITMLRKAQTHANSRYGIGGLIKEQQNAPRPITLAHADKIKSIRTGDDPED